MATEQNSASQINVGNNENVEKLTHHCGIVGILLATEGFDHRGIISIAMNNLQGRGQESAGVLVINSDRSMVWVKGQGKVHEVLTPENLNILQTPTAIIVLGQTRYSTSGRENAGQPFGENEDVSMVHNGNFTNPLDYLETFPSEIQLQAESDSWILHQAILRRYHETGDMEGSIKCVLSKAEGAYSLILAGEGKLYGIRDPKGMRPLSYGRLPDGSRMLASETSTLVEAGAKWEGDVEPGQGIVIDEDGVRTFFLDPRTNPEKLARCIFEIIYFASPDSIVFGVEVSQARRELGRALARKDAENGFLPDIVVPIQHSGIIATEGYQQEMTRLVLTCPEKFGLESLSLDELIKRVPPLQTGLIVSRSTQRAFITPDGDRDNITNTKQRVDMSTLKGKKVVLIDDSIVKGESAKPIVKKIKRAAELLGLAKPESIHLRAASAQMLRECYFGVDIPNREKLIAYRHNGDTNKIAEELGYDSVGYLSPQEMLSAVVGVANIDGMTDKEAFEKFGFCGGCFLGVYPYKIYRSKLFTKIDAPAS